MASIDQGPAALDGEPLGLADALLLTFSGEVEHNFDKGRLSCDGCPTFELIGICVEGGRYAVALPFSAWHRRTGQRLPSGAIARATPAEVAACGPSRDEPSAELRIKVWLGYLIQTS